MSDLILVGNTLFPHGTVILFVAAVFLVPFVVGWVAFLIHNRNRSF